MFKINDSSGRRWLTSGRYQRALSDQPRVPMLSAPYDILIPVVLFAIGQLFVVTSTWALGITGTFLGDYFGILMDHRVQGFPFNVLRDPMYVGSTMCFIATALWYFFGSTSRHDLNLLCTGTSGQPDSSWVCTCISFTWLHYGLKGKFITSPIVSAFLKDDVRPFTDMIYSKRASTKKALWSRHPNDIRIRTLSFTWSPIYHANLLHLAKLKLCFYIALIIDWMLRSYKLASKFIIRRAAAWFQRPYAVILVWINCHVTSLIFRMTNCAANPPGFRVWFSKPRWMCLTLSFENLRFTQVQVHASDLKVLTQQLSLQTYNPSVISIAAEPRYA